MSGVVDDDFVVRVNISARQLHEPHLVDLVAETLTDNGLPAAALCLELTESSLLVDPEGSVAVLAGLRDLGVGLALDDFGTGLLVDALPEAPAAQLVEDRPGVRVRVARRHPGSGHRRGDRAARTCAAITVTAEGVETAEQRDAVLDLG